MNFSVSAKNEIAEKVSGKPCCRTAFLSGFLRSGGRLVFSESGMALTLPHQPEKVFGLLTRFLAVERGVTAEVRAADVAVKGEGLVPLLIKLGIFSPGKEGITVTDEVPPSLVKKRCCRTNYLSGVFLGSGSVSLRSGYHLDISVSSERIAEAVCEMFGSFGIKARTTEHNEKTLIYIKEGEAVSDALALFGAMSAVLELNSNFAMRKFRCDTNRRNNCDVANISKTVNASVRQVADIKLIRRKLSFAALPEKLAAVAEMRLKYPDDNFRELAERLGISKSTLKNRLGKLDAIADELRAKKPQNDDMGSKNQGGDRIDE